MIFIWILLFILLIILAYFVYVFAQYHRLPDDITLEIENPIKQWLEQGKTYTAITWNLGYGSYPADYTFFMDGGKESRARSREKVEIAMAGDLRLLQTAKPDLVLLQEVDWEGDRSRKVDEPAVLRAGMHNYASVLAQNYNSAYLFYPVTRPIGKAKSGILTFSRFTVSEAKRYSLPIQTSFAKFFDLDRCFSVATLPVAGTDKRLQLVNVHLSAFMKDEKVQQKQILTLFDKLAEFVAAGDYAICGGDFNHDLIGNPREDLTWMKAFPTVDLPEGLKVIAPTNAPSVRANGVIRDDPQEIFGNIDGFIVSENVDVTVVQTIVNHFESTDHEAVKMTFSLK
ncbi:MAG: endonuclease/exonuclease/phosphatase family protein [Streptococcaceae bacterium]|jgi:endonuclease/exonuclease/phosphatase family metal-dependent hydrolase|nr:endonuclease/exonuclease/phosphatase family protein [Streptococcaceae bacterium]